MSTPKRTSDTMVDAIALSSPSGRMSKRARKAAEKRLAVSLFGENSKVEDFMTPTRQPSEKEALLAHAARLRDLANRGMNTKKFNREADKMEAKAKLLED